MPGKLGVYMKKNESGPMLLTLCKTEFQMDEEPQYKTWTSDNPRGSRRKCTSLFLFCSQLLEELPEGFI